MIEPINQTIPPGEHCDDVDSDTTAKRSVAAIVAQLCVVCDRMGLPWPEVMEEADTQYADLVRRDG